LVAILKAFTTTYRGTLTIGERARSTLERQRSPSPASPPSPSSTILPTAEIASALDDIASRARCLPPPSHRRPDAFHEARSELGKEIANIAKWVKTGKRPD